MARLLVVWLVVWVMTAGAGVEAAEGEGRNREPGTTSRGLDAWLTQYEYPFPLHVRRFTAQGQALEMVYMDIRLGEVEGTVGEGRSVVLLHGKHFWGAYWERTAHALAREGYRVIMPDQIGFGKSSKPAAFQFSFQELARHTNELLFELGIERVDVVGHSMGGMLATRFALTYPERTRSLTLVNPIGLEDWRRWVPPQSVDQWFAREMRQSPEDVKTYMRENYFDGEWRPEYDELLAIQQGWMRGDDYPLVAWNSALTYDMVYTQPVVHEFGDLRVPTLLIIGDRDRTALGKDLAPENVRGELGRYDRLGPQVARTIPNSDLMMMEGVGHLPQYEAFDAYIHRLTGFLGEQGSGAERESSAP